MNHRPVACLAAASLAAAMVVLPAGALAGATKSPENERAEERVKVVDFDFRPGTVSLKPGDQLPFRWSPSNVSPHNATLRDGPKGVRVKDFESRTGSTKVKFAPVFERSGKYMFRCTIHPDLMRLDVTVGR